MMTSPIIRIRFIKEVVKHRETIYLYCQKPYTYLLSSPVNFATSLTLIV